MNDKFDNLGNGFPQSVTCTLLGLALGTLVGAPVHASDFKRGPLVQISGPSLFRDCLDPGTPAGIYFPEDAGAETFVAVNPTNLKNIVATWIPGGGKGRLVSVSVDGGKKWQQVAVPGLTLCTGGTLNRVWDPWVTFAPNGELYQSGLSFSGDLKAVNVSKSSDGGFHWSLPVTLDANGADGHAGLDKDSITADPTDARFVYAAWEQVSKVNPNRRVLKFARTTDSGATWEAARQIFDPGNDNQVAGPVIVVRPDGALVCFFLILHFSNDNGGPQKVGILTVLCSTDKGQSWSAPIEVARPSASFLVTDPDTGTPLFNMSSFPPLVAPPAVDRNNGNLYVVWEDQRFSGGQSSSIALTMSTDGGLSWSAPIPVNQTPDSVALENRNAFLPAVAVARDGTVGVAYYDFRLNDANPGCLTDRWLVHCHPTTPAACADPANWNSEVRLTDTSFDLEKAVSFPDGYWLGDYEGLATAGNDFVAVFPMPAGTEPNRIFSRRVGP